MLRRILLAASDSARMRQLVTSAPVARGVVARYVAGDAAADAVAVAAAAARGRAACHAWTTWARTPATHGRRTRSPASTPPCWPAWSRPGSPRAAATEVSVKPTAVGLGLADHGEKTATENISRICAAARAAGTTVTVDMEDHSHVDATLRIVRALRAEFADLGCVIQSQLRRSAADCAALATPGSRVRLCKGAYDAPQDVAFTRPRRGGPVLCAVPAGADAGRRVPDAGHS